MDLGRRLILVRRSGERSTTKSGHADTVPVHPELVPFFERALETASGDLLFPGKEGRMCARTRAWRPFCAAPWLRDGLRPRLPRAGL